ncbi:hypothetical protein EHQ76_04970 [Leptospira barantonii]|uniref:Amidohydrolase-related domain-containing protein n=1 Tax=Leptospira barantonii TaxID=2023184 RepID=A0A5F2BNV5_9LEPT|nr:amidohydrolase family protein [Leptospira barantonii]TGM07226.1 hypothetical protein EHQ76_04970 [Leptospira barantonii]
MKRFVLHLILYITLLFLFLFVWIFYFVFKIPSPSVQPDETFVLEGVRLFDPGKKSYSNLDLRFQDSKIVSINDSVNPPNSEFANMIVTPGLTDMHAHLPPNNLLDLIPYFSLLYLSHGVTTLRIAGDIDGTSVPYAKNGIFKNDFFGPRILSCDAFVTTGPPRWKNSIVVNSPEEAAQAVITLKSKGADCIKSYENLNVPMIRAVVEAANKENLTVLGHVPFGLTYEEAAIPDVQHFHGIPRPEWVSKNNVVNRVSDWDRVDDRLLNDIVNFSVRNRIANTPTLVASERLLLYRDYNSAISQPSILLMPRFFREIVWNPSSGIPAYRNLDVSYLNETVEKALFKKLKLVLKLFQAGAKLRIGSDAQQPFVVPGESVQGEMVLFHKAGIPSEDVWKIATVDANENLKNQDSFHIEKGFSPDLLVFRKDPVKNLENMSSLYAVVARGKLYRKKDLDLLVKAHQDRLNDSIYENISMFLGRIALEKQTRDFKH